MDFFGREEQARGRSRLYTFLFFLASTGTVASVGLIAWGVKLLAQRYPVLAFFWNHDADPRVFIIGVTALTLLIILVAVVQRTFVLSRGGRAVAEQLGGTPVAPDEREPARRQLLNVVEEMAIAAGLPVPSVYLLEREPAINAFAAGLSPNDAVVGVTRGALELLSRDELQGVVAHEFSHILNGDMALNIQLSVQLYGLTAVSHLGQVLATAPFRARADDQTRDHDGLIDLVAAALGCVIMAVGAIGAAFGGAFMSAVSRQRELLADASAVQFTRNPEAVASALKKIAALPVGARLESPAAAQASHFLFADGGGWFTTHPSLYDRILAIEPSFDGTLPELGALQAGDASPPRPPTPHLDRAEAVTAALPPALVAAARDPGEARAVIAALLFEDDPAVQARQLDALTAADEPAFVTLVRTLAPFVRSCPVEARLPLAQLSAPALRRLSEAQYRGWRRVLFRLVDASPRLTLFQFALQRSVLRRLEPSFARDAAPARPAPRALASLGGACAVLLSALARSDDAPEDVARDAFGAGAAALGGAGTGLALCAAADCALEHVDGALDALGAASSDGRRLLVAACRAVIVRDEKVTMDELELVRVVADALDCPLPPLS